MNDNGSGLIDRVLTAAGYDPKYSDDGTTGLTHEAAHTPQSAAGGIVKGATARTLAPFNMGDGSQEMRHIQHTRDKQVVKYGGAPGARLFSARRENNGVTLKSKAPINYVSLSASSRGNDVFVWIGEGLTGFYADDGVFYYEPDLYIPGGSPTISMSLPPLQSRAITVAVLPATANLVSTYVDTVAVVLGYMPDAREYFVPWSPLENIAK